MASLSLPAFTAVRRLTTAHARPPFLPYLEGTRYRPSQSLSKLSIRRASQWNRYRPSPSYSRFQAAYDIWRVNPAVRLGVGVISVGGGVFYFSNLEDVPVSGRRRFNCISPQQEAAITKRSSEELLRLYSDRILPPNHPYSRLVSEVAGRLLPVSGIQDQKWEVRVIDDLEEKNAFVTGDKIFVFSGILPICQGEDGLAVVLGHEIGHSVAHHIAESLSKTAPLQILALAISLMFDISGGFSQSIVDIALKKTNSRTQESEADYIGLLMVAKACYDPHAAVGLWHRMAKEEKDARHATPQFLSTHPASQNRVKTIEHWLPEAADVQAASECGRMESYGKSIDGDRIVRISNNVTWL